MSNRPYWDMRNKKTSGLIHRLAVFLFFFCLASVGVLSFILVKPDFSDIENRPLVTAPAFSADSLFSGEFAEKFTAYYSDTFPFREKMIEEAGVVRSLRGVKAEGDVSIHWGTGSGDFDDNSADAFNDPESVLIQTTAVSETTPVPVTEDNSGVLNTPPVVTTTVPAETDPPFIETTVPDAEAGAIKDGIILVGDRAMNLYGYSESANARYAALINSFAEKYRGRIKTEVMVVPTSVAFYLPSRYASMSGNQRKAIDFIYSKLSADVGAIKTYDLLARHADEYVYFRTDHHWTGLGAYYAYGAFCDYNGDGYMPLTDYTEIRHDGFFGSFYKSIGSAPVLTQNPDYAIVYKPPFRYSYKAYMDGKYDEADAFYMNLGWSVNEITSSNKYLAYSGGDVDYGIISNLDNTGGRKLMISKESFADAMIPFLAENYSELHIIDFRFYKGSLSALIEKTGIDTFLFINATAIAGSDAQCNRLGALLDS